MVTIRSVNDIILSLIDFFKLVQPELDTKQGTVARDLFIDAPSSQLSLLYDELALISNSQSLRLVSGTDLEKLAKNFGISRTQASSSGGVALLTFSSIDAPIPVSRGDLVFSSNGFAFSIVNSVSILPSNSNFYRSTASKFKADLDFVGITDQFAIEVSTQCTTPGTSGNIGKYSLVRTSIPGISNVTNSSSFNGGLNQEDDATFRDRILAVFSGSSVGTALGYQNTALSVSGVSDVTVIEPGDPLMTRDGTVSEVVDGTLTVISEGSGGKVDVVILGSSLQENIDSFIYRDKSNNNDPTDSKNDFVLGQIIGDQNKTITRKRVDNIKNGTLPAQPVESLIEVSGSLSGSNFKEKTVDNFGRVSGNYELVKDTGIYAGSPWGFDTFKWISNKISLFSEDRVKGQYNGQDNLTFIDVLEIPKITQNIPILNENSRVTVDRSIIQLLHYPAINVTRVFNVNTGERYIITNQNLDGTGTTNTTGRIKISGNTLPNSTDILQVDYSWVVTYDQYSDYDGKSNTDNTRTVTDSIDWGFANLVNNESVLFTRDTVAGFFTGTTKHPISSVIFANYYSQLDGEVFRISSGSLINRLAVTFSNFSSNVTSVEFVKLKNTNIEVYSTSDGSGLFTSAAALVDLTIKYNVTVVLPLDTQAVVGDIVTAFVNSTDTFTISDSIGSFSDNIITIPQDNISSTANNVFISVSYIANVNEMQSSTISSLPFSRSGNGFINNNLGFNNFYLNNISKRDIQSIQLNDSNQLYVQISVSDNDTLITTKDVLAIIRLTDSAILWDQDNIGSIVIDSTTNFYQFVLSGVNSPQTGDRVLIVYYGNDIRKFQPFTFQNTVFKSGVRELLFDTKFYFNINSFTDEDPLSFTIVDPNSDLVISTITDGYLISDDDQAIVSSLTTDFNSISDLLFKKVKITGINAGTYDIVSYDILTNRLTIKNVVDHVSPMQVSVIRIFDGKEVWNSTGEIVGNKIRFSGSINLTDDVYFILFNSSNLRQSPTKIIANLSDQVVNKGSISLFGNTLLKVDTVITAINSGLKQNTIEAARKALNLSSSSALPSTIKLVRLAKLEKVTTISSTSQEIFETLVSYDLFNTKIKDNYLYDSHVQDSSLSNVEFELPNTVNNTLDNADNDNVISIGDRLRIVCYFSIVGDSEILNFTRNGVLYTNKIFTHLDKCQISSGFNSSQTSRILFNTFTQPGQGSRFKAFYDYLAPKQNERILIRFNYNKLISDVTFNIETNRPINADVLARGGKNILVDVTMNIVITEDMLLSTNLVVQNLKDKIIAALNVNTLGAILDASDLINLAYTVSGVDRARILYFNETGGEGQVLSLTAEKDEFFSANLVTINVETR